MRLAALCALALLAAILPLRSGHAFELEQGINAAGVIDYPTARNQPTTHTLHGTIELTDISEPELHFYNLRYGLQLGAFQLLADGNYALEPRREFDFLEVKAKLQILTLDEFRMQFAVGALGRFVENSEEREARIDDKTASLFGIYTVELFPFRDWGGFLVNFYLDNRVAVLGLKVQLYQSIQAVAEAEHLHSTLREDDTHGRLGVSFEGLQNVYFQLVYTDQGENWLVQIGTGF